MGEYVHHEPTVSEEEELSLEEAYNNNTRELYRQLFGSPDPELFADGAMVCDPGGDYD